MKTDSANVNYLDAYPDATADPEFVCIKCKAKVHWTINDMCIKCYKFAFPSLKYVKEKLGDHHE